MARSKHEHKEFFSFSVSLHERKKLHQQFTENLRSILYDPEKMLEALNFRTSITINGYVQQELTMAEVSQAFKELEQNYSETYSIHPQIKIDDTLLRSGLTDNDIWCMTISQKLFYDAAIYYALAPVLSPASHENITGTIAQIYHKFFDKKELSVEQQEQEDANLEQSIISMARHVIREHQAFVFSHQKLVNLLQDPNVNEDMCKVGYQLLDDITAFAKTPQGYSNPEWLTKVLETCSTAIEIPSIESSIKCAILSQQAGNRSIPSAIKNALMTLAGFTLISASILLGVETLGLAAPISAIGISMGASMLAATASTSAVIGILGTGKGASGFFKSIHQSDLSTRLDALSTNIDSYCAV